MRRFKRRRMLKRLPEYPDSQVANRVRAQVEDFDAVADQANSECSNASNLAPCKSAIPNTPNGGVGKNYVLGVGVESKVSAAAGVDHPVVSIDCKRIWDNYPIGFGISPTRWDAIFRTLQGAEDFAIMRMFIDTIESLGVVALPPDGWRIVSTSAALWQRLRPIEPIVSRQVEEFSTSPSRFKLSDRNRCVGRPIRTAPIAGQSSPFFGRGSRSPLGKGGKRLNGIRRSASTVRSPRRRRNLALAAS